MSIAICANSIAQSRSTRIGKITTIRTNIFTPDGVPSGELHYGKNQSQRLERNPRPHF